MEEEKPYALEMGKEETQAHQEKTEEARRGIVNFFLSLKLFLFSSISFL
jgi:hypothetical protein